MGDYICSALTVSRHFFNIFRFVLFPSSRGRLLSVSRVLDALLSLPVLSGTCCVLAGIQDYQILTSASGCIKITSI